MNNLANQRFGRLLVTSKTDKRYSREIVWECLCDCGRTHQVRSSALTSGNTKSCGCLVKDNGPRTHGMANKHPLYKKWKSIKSRCYAKNNIGYSNYGGRGIRVCPEWMNDFEAFYKWALSAGWEQGLTIDRIDNDGDYCPENCRFVSFSKNAGHKRLLSSANTSGFCGVTYVNRDKKFQSSLRIMGEKFSCGHYDNPVHAAVARDICIINKDAGKPLNLPELSFWQPI